MPVQLISTRSSLDGGASSVPRWRDPGALLLISCYELGHQPLGLASPMAFLERAGFAPGAIDIAVQELAPEAVSRARFVGISVPMHTALRLGIQAAQRVKEINPACHICFYGLYASLNAGLLLDGLAESVIGGEYEGPLVKLVQTLAGESAGSVDGVTARGGRAAPWLERLPFPAPSRSKLPPLERYARLEHRNTLTLVGYVETSRGCLHRCLHCPITPVYDGRFFVVPREVVLEDIRKLVDSGARHITFGDPDFLNGPGHSMGVVRDMHAVFPDLTFDITTKVEHILKHRTVFPELGQAGCLFVVSAVESLSDTVLTNLEKGHTRADVSVALEVVRAAGISLRPSLVSFTPWTTYRDYLNVLDWVEREELIDHVDPVQFGIRLLVPPGSALLSSPALIPHLGPLVRESLSFNWKHPDPHMDNLHRVVNAELMAAARTGQDPAVTFIRVVELARGLDKLHGGAGGRLAAGPARARSPRLTEAWFCCAEPTDDQVRALRTFKRLK
ncbi:MAG: radical SAM protein [Acidobacteria bacterium]|nr:radical SAM protein [Acidobacteriota bacterium]